MPCRGCGGTARKPRPVSKEVSESRFTSTAPKVPERRPQKLRQVSRKTT